MQFILSLLQLVLYRVAAVKRLPVHHYIAKERWQCCTITLPHMNRNNTAESAIFVSLICSLLPEALHSEII